VPGRGTCAPPVWPRARSRGNGVFAARADPEGWRSLAWMAVKAQVPASASRVSFRFVGALLVFVRFAQPSCRCAVKGMSP